MKMNKTTREAIEKELKSFLDSLQEDDIESLNFGVASSDFRVVAYRSDDYAEQGTIRDEARP